MKIFGLELFKFRKEVGILWDFAQFGLVKSRSMQLGVPTETTGWVTVAGEQMTQQTPPKIKKEKLKITPKMLFKMKALNDKKFFMNIDQKYIKSQLELLDEKINYYPKQKKIKNNEPIPIQMGAIRYGKEELLSIKERLENRLKIKLVKETFNKYPHTTSKLINHVLRDNSHLSFERVENYLPDLPKDAIQSMKEYDKMCITLCNKKAVFYIIAEQQDFERKNEHRDPVLMAQSPFGHFWQILGAWDEEIILLDEL